jgi:hypothetical protein
MAANATFWISPLPLCHEKNSSTKNLPRLSMADCRTGPGAAGEEIPGLRLTVWDQQDQKVQYPKLQKDVSADVVVVGAGIAGLSVA